MKRIFTSLLVALVALLIPNTIWAADPDLANDYTLVKSITWGDGTNIAGSGSCAYTAYETGNKKQQSLTLLTAPEDAVGWIAMQAWTDGSGKGWWNRSDKGLYCVSAGRSACVYGDDLTTGWLVVFECSQTASNVITLTNASGEPDGTFSYVASEDGKSYFCTITAAENAYIGFCGNKNAGFINKISVYKPNKAVVPTTYTVKYQDMSGNALKDSVKYDAIVGASISLSDADKANITVSETTYVYDSDDTEGVTVAENGATVVIVKFHAAANFNYTVNEVCGETNARVTNGTSYETANVKLGYRKYNAVNGQLYKKDAVNKEFNYSFKLTQDNQVENIAYTLVEGTNNVVFCAEGEDIEGLTPITEGNTTIRSSNSSSAFAPADTKITTLAPGKYKIHAAIYDCATSPNSDWTFMVGAIQAASFNCTTVNIQEFDSQEFAIGRETDLVMLKAGSSSRGLDAIYILKTGDVTPDEAADLNAAADAAAALAAAKADLLADITAAKAIDTTDMNGAAELAAAITAAETAIAAKDATVDSITAAKAELAKAVSAFRAANFNFATAIVNADFSSMEGWTENVSGGFRDFGNGLIGTYRVRTDDFIPAATVDETHLATEYCIGLEARWEGNFASYNQDVMLPAGNYKLTFDVENVNAGTTSANYNNLFKVTNGETVYVDESTEWMNGKSGWTSHAIRFILTEDATVNISLGFGTGSNNFGHANTPALYVSHLALGTFDPLVDFKEIALKEVDALPTGDALFLYPVDAVNTAKAAIETAATVDDINAAVATAKAAQNKPAADKAYKITNTTATGNLCIAEGKISVAQGATVKFTAVEGGYVLSKDSLYVFKTTDNNWTLSTTKNIAEAYVLTFNPVEGGYTIKGAKGLFGLDSTDEGSTVYANKSQDKNGLWTIAEYVAPVTDYTNYIVNADLTAAEIGWEAEGTKTSDYKEGSGIVKAGNNAQFDFKQTIANLPAGKYKVTAQAAYRYSGSEADEYAAIAAGTPTKFAKLYATVGKNTVDTLVQNRYDGASETNYLGQDDGVATVNEKFVPNSSDAVKAWFAAGQYVNEVVFNIAEEGPVTIGIVKTAQPEAGDYTVIGPWTLTRLGDAEAEPEPEPEPQPGQDMTKYITNPSFETGNTNGWTYETSNDHGAKRNDNGTYTMTNCDGDYLFNIWSSGNAISQKIENLPNGTYLMKAVIATDANQQVQLNANGKSIKIDAVGKETGVEGELEFDVLNNTATIGAEGVNKYWYKVDNFRLTFVKGFDIAALKDIYKTALAEAQAITGNMSAEAKLALTAAIAVEVDTTEASSLITAANTLTEAAATANASVAAYAKAKAAIDAAKAEMAATNVYTTEALEAYKAVYDAAEPKYENGTMTDEEAKALENPTTITGWHDATIVDNFLLSAWDTNPDFQDAPYYINTWSTEGNNDGSNFKVPFFEYWTSDANSLGAKTLTATMNSLPAGDYDISAWVRVRIKNGAEAPATGITLQANEGEAVNVAAGDQIGTSQFYLKEFTATGTVAEDGVLKIKFNVAADNNISWLSFKNVKFEKKPFKPEAIEGALYSWESPEGLPGEYGGKISYVNGVDNRLNYQNSGYYTICLNGKKANLNDTIASANASYMLVTLDEALSEGDTIYITAYVNKNASKKASAYILFDNGADVESPVYSDEANIDTLFNGVPTTKSIIVTEAMAGAKSFKMTRGQTGTNLFITKFVIMKKKSEPVEPAKYEYNGYVAIARIAQNNVLGDVTSETQKVTITETEDKAIVAVTFSGFETFPEFTFNANVTGGDSVTYTVAEGSKVNVQQGQMAIEYNLTGNGTQASTEAIPTIALQMFQNPAMTINVVFAATAEEAKAALLKTTGIINIARDGQKSVIYNINGQKVNKAQKGLFIINGKKVVNK